MKSYKLEIIFGGGAVVLLQGPERLKHPLGVRVLLVRTSNNSVEGEKDKSHNVQRHFPRLTVLANDYLDLPSGRPLHASRGGLAETSIDLEGLNVFFTLSGNPKPRRFSLKWAPIGVGRAPRRPELGRSGEEGKAWEFMDWILPAKAVGLQSIDPSQAASCVNLPPGHLEASRVSRLATGDQSAIIWEVETPAKEIHEQAIAETLVYSVEGLVTPLKVTLQGREEEREDEIVRLFPRPGKTLRLAITNLPGASSGSKISHMEQYKTIGSAPDGISIPEPADGFSTQDSICPKLLGYEGG